MRSLGAYSYQTNNSIVSSQTPSVAPFFIATSSAVVAQGQPSPIRLLVASEQTLLLEGISSLCDAVPHFQVTAQASSGQEALQKLERFRPEVALLDLELTDLLALEVIKRAAAAQIPTRCAVFSSRKDRKTVMDALRFGASGYLLKSSSRAQLVEALRHLSEGGIYVSPQIELASLVYEGSNGQRSADPLESLSSREYQVFSLLVDGIRAKEIAARLALSPKTVDTYRASLMRKLEIHDVAGLVKFALQRNLTA
jgi:DNA-binding NarL/FixJ family response regulator